MKNRIIINPDEILKAFKKATKEQKNKKSLNVTYLDEDGNIKVFKSKINRR